MREEKASGYRTRDVPVEAEFAIEPASAARRNPVAFGLALFGLVAAVAAAFLYVKGNGEWASAVLLAVAMLGAAGFAVGAGPRKQVRGVRLQADGLVMLDEGPHARSEMHATDLLFVVTPDGLLLADREGRVLDILDLARVSDPAALRKVIARSRDEDDAELTLDDVVASLPRLELTRDDRGYERALERMLTEQGTERAPDGAVGEDEAGDGEGTPEQSPPAAAVKVRVDTVSRADALEELSAEGPAEASRD